jgi:hypothetical protein
MDAAQVAHDPQKESRFLRHSFGCVGVCLPACRSSTAKQAHTQCRCGSLEFTKNCFACNQTFGIPGLRVQEHGEAEAQTLVQRRLHGSDRLEFLGRECLAALGALEGKFDQTVRNDVSDVFQIDDDRQDILAPRTFELVVESLLIADVCEVAPDGGGGSGNKRTSRRARPPTRPRNTAASARLKAR